MAPTVIDRRAANERVPTTSLRRTSLWAGVLSVITFVSIPTLALLGPGYEANYMLGAGSEAALLFGGLRPPIAALAGIGIAVVLSPVLKRQGRAHPLIPTLQPQMNQTRNETT